MTQPLDDFTTGDFCSGKWPVNHERAIGFIGHPDAGKTELVRRVLAEAPVTEELAEVPSDTIIIDFWNGPA